MQARSYREAFGLVTEAILPGEERKIILLFTERRGQGRGALGKKRLQQGRGALDKKRLQQGRGALGKKRLQRRQLCHILHKREMLLLFTERRGFAALTEEATLEEATMGTSSNGGARGRCLSRGARKPTTVDPTGEEEADALEVL
ncbi:hypothetical protein BHE74_00025065 [Ensete ventricosum]|nr:hypothetical protein GW17_00009029 [Ensete ventricosum]RWW67481.1 hypothetical protein BHE74_00025065 [Ensete ventricosum]